MAAVLSLPSFSDAAAHTEVDSIERPWKGFWPPSGEHDIQYWLKTDSPEFLKWKFNAKNTFDRPWRSYTRTEAAKVEPAYTIMSGADPVPSKDDTRKISEAELIPDHAANIPPVLCQELEDDILARQLPFVDTEEFNYLAPLELYKTQKPYLSRLPFVPELKRSSIVGKSYPVRVYNVRGNEDMLTLDKSGFEFHNVPFHLDRWTDDNVQSDYIPHLKNWLEGYFGPEKIFIYAYNFRGAGFQAGDKPWKSPFYLAHCDATEASCKLRMSQHFPDEVDKVLSKRYRFVNIWRSVTPPDQDCPLALCDYRTVTKKEYISTDVIFPHCCDEGYDVQYSPAHRWFYQKGMTTDEIVMFKLDDSAGGVSKCVAHSAFKDPSAKPQTAHRASIEVRAIIVGGK